MTPDNWTGKLGSIPRTGPIRPITSLVANPPRLVAELSDATTATWREELIRSVFLPFDADAILVVPLCTRNIEDFWSWSGERRGFFSVKSAYQMVLNTKFQRENWLEENAGVSDVSSEGTTWTSLWHTKVPSKQNFFTWRLAQHSVPTADVLHHRNMSQSPLCVLCGAPDSWRHALLDCTMLRCIWALSDEHLVEQMSLNTDANAKNWLFALHEVLLQTDFVRLIITLWAVWRARRKAIYEDIFTSPMSTHQFINSYLNDLKEIETPGRTVNAQPTARPTQWLHPPATLAKINVDAAVKSIQRRGAVAALCRDQHGNFLGASAVIFKRISDRSYNAGGVGRSGGSSPRSRFE